MIVLSSAESSAGMFDFEHKFDRQLIRDPDNGTVAQFRQ
jgi:hypothetical protein